MTAKSIWDGTLRFGLVAIPVGLVPTRVDRDTGFRTLHRTCGTPIKRKPWCPTHERVLEGEELMRGFEVAPEQFVTIEDAELQGLAPDSSRSVEIRCLLDADRLDPAQVERTYYLSASETPIGRRPYVLLHRLLVEQNRVAICRLVYRGAEWLVAVRPHPSRSLLLLQKLCFAEELVDARPIESGLVRDVELREQELELGRELAAKLWRTKPSPTLFRDEHGERVRRLVEAKLAGGTIVEPVRADPEVLTLPSVDLTEALRGSIRGARVRLPGEAAPRARTRARR